MKIRCSGSRVVPGGQTVKTSNFMKIRPVGAELLHTDGRTEGWMDRRAEANGRFSQFSESA